MDGQGPCVDLSYGHPKHQLWLKTSRNQQNVTYFLEELMKFTEKNLLRDKEQSIRLISNG